MFKEGKQPMAFTQYILWDRQCDSWNFNSIEKSLFYARSGQNFQAVNYLNTWLCGFILYVHKSGASKK